MLSLWITLIFHYTQPLNVTNILPPYILTLLNQLTVFNIANIILSLIWSVFNSVQIQIW